MTRNLQRRTGTGDNSRASATVPASADFIEWGREVLQIEAQSIEQLSQRLDEQFVLACRRVIQVVESNRHVVVTGMGKAGLVGQKVAATLSSTGVPSQFLHPSEAIHGDLGRVSGGDVVLAFSNSGETEEVVRLLPSFRELGADVISVTADAESTLGRFSSHVLSIGKLDEACPLGLAPSATTAAMIAIGDALALVVSRARGFKAADFAKFHPGGSLGRKLARVEELMRPLDECRVAQQSSRLRDVLAAQSHRQRRTGATMLVNKLGELTGLVTDSDLVRRIANGEVLPLDAPVSSVMTADPKTIPVGCRMAVALEILTKHKISELPVVDGQSQPVGLIDVTDIIELLPADHSLMADQDPPGLEAETALNAPSEQSRIRIYRSPEEGSEPT